MVAVDGNRFLCHLKVGWVAFPTGADFAVPRSFEEVVALTPVRELYPFQQRFKASQEKQRSRRTPWQVMSKPRLFLSTIFD